MKKTNYSIVGSITDFMIGVIFTLFFMAVGVVLVLNLRPIYYLDISLLNIEETSGFSKEVIKENYDALMDYNSPFFQGELKFPTLEASDNGLQHFKEVKQIFVGFYWILLITGILLIPTVIYKKKRDESLHFLRSAAALILIIPTIVGIAFAVNFDQAFVVFHKIFFNNDYWIFSPETDPVITMLPDTFFMHCAIGIIAVMILSSLALYLIYRRKNAHSSDLTV